MALIAKEPEGNFEQIETGTYQAVCTEVIDLGMRETNTFDKSGIINGTTEKHKTAIIWELAEERSDGKRYVFSKEYVVSLHAKATLRLDLDSWRGIPFTLDELKGFDVEKVIGANCMLTMSAYTRKNGQEGRKISSVSKLMKGLPKIEMSPTYMRPKFITDILNGSSKESLEGFFDGVPHPDESNLPY